MKLLWVTAEIDATAADAWAVLVDPEAWPAWGPSVAGASIDAEQIGLGTRGTVTTVLGVKLPFEVTEFEAGHRWAWKVAGIGATSHTVDPLGPHRCRVGFGVPLAAAPYLAVCRVALGRIERLVSSG